MDNRRIYKCNVIGEDEEKINNLLTDPMFSNKIINPCANVGVIMTDKFIVQVDVMSEKRYHKMRKFVTSSLVNTTFELGEKTPNLLTAHVEMLKLLNDYQSSV